MRPSLPSPDWVSQETWSFTPAVTTHLLDPPSNHALHPSMPFSLHRPKPPSRTVVSAPLIVRSPDPSVYDPAGRSRFLESIGIPSHLHDPNTTRILIVSFGGQIFHRPQSRCHSRSSSAVQTPGSGTSTPARTASGTMREPFRPRPSELSKSYFPNLDTHAEALTVALHSASLNDNEVPRTSARIDDKEPSLVVPLAGTRPRATSVLNVPGAPPAAVPTSPTAPGASKSLPTHPAPVFATVTIPPSPDRNDRSGEAAYDYLAADGDYEEEVSRLLPDDSWIAIVCGVSKEWGKENGEELPHNFFVAPRDVYMPDLTAVADVLLGKLGYGTVSECVDSCTPFVYVPRPLFIEEHGLRLLLEKEGVGVELSRTSYEMGEWADAVEEAWLKGKNSKKQKRAEGENGMRGVQGRGMAKYLVDWLQRWKATEVDVE
ncbi:hypothetical protein AcW1_008191 [Taiwanofungus camphoratus]|nr:hypothetical protein AcW1_008191 [Antrodia cinnamomea]